MPAIPQSHWCETEDGPRILCLCSTGRDHTEGEMDQPAEDKGGEG